MTRRLFWKIFIAFALTFFLISQGIWLLFSLEADRYGSAIAKMAMAAATNSLREGGLSQYKRDLNFWPKEIGQHLSAEALPSGSGRLNSSDGVLVNAPNLQTYRISFRSGDWRRTPPLEVVMAGALGGLLFSALLAWYLTSPIERMRLGFRRLAGGNFLTRLGPSMGRRRDEIADLARDFDQMAAQLEELVAARDRLLADVSHELRTPLARLNVAIGLARLDPQKIELSLDRISSEAVKLDELVGELLTLSKLESDTAPAEEYFDFGAILAGVVDDASFEAASKGVQVKLDLEAWGDDEWVARGNGMLAHRAVENIVRNAVRYSPPGGCVDISLRHEEDHCRLVVSDEGPGIARAEINRLFRPFSQSADGLGFGLGLAIAQRAVAVNGGTIAAQNRDVGGLEMTIKLPLAMDFV